MTLLSDLQADVAAEDTVIDSTMTLLKGLKAALDAAGTDPVALAAAVAANTPAAPAP